MFDPEKGMSEEEFADVQASFKREMMAREGKKDKMELKLYFEFKTPEMRDAAKRLLVGEHDPLSKTFKEGLWDKNRASAYAFRCLTRCRVDPNRPDVGLEMDFFRNPPNLREAFEKIFTDNGLTPREEYETLNGEPQPGKTVFNHSGD